MSFLLFLPVRASEVERLLEDPIKNHHHNTLINIQTATKERSQIKLPSGW